MYYQQCGECKGLWHDKYPTNHKDCTTWFMSDTHEPMLKTSWRGDDENVCYACYQNNSKRVKMLLLMIIISFGLCLSEFYWMKTYVISNYKYKRQGWDR